MKKNAWQKTGIIWLITGLIFLIVIGLMWRFSKNNQLLSSEPDASEFVTWVDRGIPESIAAELELRIQTLEASLEANTNEKKDISQILELGNLKYTYGDLAGAKEQYERILLTHPTDAPAHENLGQTLLEMGDVAQAEEHWRAAIASSPYEVTYIKLADLIDASFFERHAEIQPLLEEAIATLGQSPALLVRLGNWYRQEKDFERALSHYQVALRLQPENTSLIQLINEVKEEQKNSL